MDHGQVYSTYGEWAEEIVRGCCYFRASYTHHGFVPSHSIFRYFQAYSPWTLHTPSCIQLLLKGLCSVYCKAERAATGGDRSLAQLSLFSIPSALQCCPLHPTPTHWTATEVLALSWPLSTAADSSGNGPIVPWRVGGTVGWETPVVCKAQAKRSHRTSVGLTGHTKCQPLPSAEGSQKRAKVWANTRAHLTFGQAEVAQVSLKHLIHFNPLFYTWTTRCRSQTPHKASRVTLQMPKARGGQHYCLLSNRGSYSGQATKLLDEPGHSWII